MSELSKKKFINCRCETKMSCNVVRESKLLIETGAPRTAGKNSFKEEKKQHSGRIVKALCFLSPYFDKRVREYRDKVVRLTFKKCTKG